MGVENVVFILIFQLVGVSMGAGCWLWFSVAKTEQLTAIGYVGAYIPLVVGFAVSMAGLALLAVDLPEKGIPQAVVNFVFELPIICFVVIPVTVKLIKIRRLTLGMIGLLAVIGWFALSLVALWLSRGHAVPPLALPVFLKSTIAPMLICELPIPLAALWFFRRKWKPVGEGHL